MAAAITREPFGEVDGVAVDRYTLRNPSGVTVSLLTWGGTIQQVLTPDRDGSFTNITLGFDDLAGYRSEANAFFGCITGRFANRIAGAEFEIDGVRYPLAKTHGDLSLHGGTRGFDKYIWDAEAAEGADGLAVRFHRVSPDGEEGFPGALDTTVTYTLTPDDALRLDYRSTTTRPTVLNLTNHAYWNLAGLGRGNIERHVMQVNASRFTAVGPDLIPTDPLAPVDGTVFDFRTPTAIGDRIRANDPQIDRGNGYDHNWVIDRPDGDRALVTALTLHEPDSGRTLQVDTTEVGIQVYCANHFNGKGRAAGGWALRQSDGVALETQAIPDAPHLPGHGGTLLRPGEVRQSTTVFRFGTDRP